MPSSRPVSRVSDHGVEASEHDQGAHELEDRYRRTLADLDNARKRFARDAARNVRRNGAGWRRSGCRYSTTSTSRSSTPPPTPARSSRASSRSPAGFDVLSRLGYPRRSDEGATFDPARHEVVAAVPDPDAPRATILRRDPARVPATATMSCARRRLSWRRASSGSHPRLLRRSGVTETASREEISGVPETRAAYHPDVNSDPDAEDRFKEISEAYDVLSDPDTPAALRRVRRGLPQYPGCRSRDLGPRRSGRHPRQWRTRGGGIPGGGREEVWFGGRGRYRGPCFGGCSGACAAARGPIPRRRPGGRTCC